MGQLRDRMERDLQIRGYSVHTRDSYLRRVRDFVAYFGRPPDELTPEHIRQYQLYLTKEKKVSWAYFNQVVCGLRFFYCVTLEKEWDVNQIPYQRTGRKLPVVLSREAVALLLSAPSNIKHRAILMTLYSSGVRVDELVHLRVVDVDSERMAIRVERGKGRKDRYTLLSESLLPVLREYWRQHRPDYWLFPGQYPGRHLNVSSVQRVVRVATQKARISKPVTPHTMRHCFATHLLESGVNIRVIQRLLGHNSLSSTQIYTHVANNHLRETPSPLESIKDLIGTLPKTTG